MTDKSVVENFAEAEKQFRFYKSPHLKSVRRRVAFVRGEGEWFGNVGVCGSGPCAGQALSVACVCGAGVE